MNMLYTERPIVINPQLAKKIGLNETIVLQQLNYWLQKTRAGIEHEGKTWIYNTYAEWHEQVPFFSERTIQRVMLKLESMGLISSKPINKSKGDMTKFYTINQDHDLLKSPPCQSGTTIVPDRHHHGARMAPSSCQNGTLSTETTTETTTEESAKTKKRFSPPSVGDVRLYCIERKNSIDAEAFVDYYNSNGWMVGRNRMKDWRAAVRQWERRQSDYNRSQSAGQSPARPGSYQGVEI